MIEAGNIINNLTSTEPVRIIRVQPLGTRFSVRYEGINSAKINTKVLTKEDIQGLKIVSNEGEFNFKGEPEKFVLFAEAERINSAYQFDPLFAINCSVVDPLPHQVEAVYKFLLPQHKIRFLLADDTGAGKTIMTGLLVKELMMRNIIERVLIVTPGGLTKQWQEDEMGVKFNINFTLANRAAFEAEPTIFQTHDRIVTSIDFISREDIMNIVSNSTWDLVVIDEAHKLSAYEYGQKTYRSRRYEAAAQLSKQCEHILLLTATPHRGRTDTFKSLLQILDEDIFATADLAADRVKELSKEGINKFFIRRLKEDMRDWNGNPLYKPRHTKTVSYQLNPEEKRLYDAVTEYLTVQKKQANDSKNIYVSLALAVMQRRLVSSIYAVKNTLERRWKALQDIVDEFGRNPTIWNQRLKKSDNPDCEDIDQYDELDDEEREALDNLLADPKKFKLFTTGKTLEEIRNEANEVKHLFDMASDLYASHVEEKKYEQLKQLLKSQGVVDGEKLVIFTEHKDTLIYLHERLTNSGYNVSTIHGGMSIEERRQNQVEFMRPDTQILIATDAAGEGINLQFCRLLINWDIPWNPNRLEQRMGRVHRYGQKRDVLVFNMVAENTREGKVLSTLLTKLDIIREGLGDDRVYDVIQDVLKGVPLDEIISSVFEGKESQLDAFVSQDANSLEALFKEKIDCQKKILNHSIVNFASARKLKESSDEQRLQPIYIRLFFERAFKYLGGEYQEKSNGIYEIKKIPDILASHLKEHYNIPAQNIGRMLFCFDKKVFLDYQNSGNYLGRVHYINPGNALFDSLVQVVRNLFREDMLKGTVLISPEDAENKLAYFVKCQIADNRISKDTDSIANEKLMIVLQDSKGDFSVTSPAKYLDCQPPSVMAKDVELPSAINSEPVLSWTFENVSLPLFEETERKVEEDVAIRTEYLRTAFTQVIMDIESEINDLQHRLFWGNGKEGELLQMRIDMKRAMEVKRDSRIKMLQEMRNLDIREPEILGCAYLVALNNLEYHSRFNMSRDDEVESIAMAAAMEYERGNGRIPQDVSADNVGYDIMSVDANGMKRYIEVKGRAGTDGVMLSENEMNRLSQLDAKAWLYIVTDCKNTPKLHTINNPANVMTFERRYKGIQYFLPLDEWQKQALNQ